MGETMGSSGKESSNSSSNINNRGLNQIDHGSDMLNGAGHNVMNNNNNGSNHMGSGHRRDEDEDDDEDDD